MRFQTEASGWDDRRRGTCGNQGKVDVTTSHATQRPKRAWLIDWDSRHNRVPLINDDDFVAAILIVVLRQIIGHDLSVGHGISRFQERCSLIVFDWKSSAKDVKKVSHHIYRHDGRNKGGPTPVDGGEEIGAAPFLGERATQYYR
jgi:hypothetical protein